METLSKPKRYFPKPGRKMGGKKAARQMPVTPISPITNQESLTSEVPLQEETQTQIANRIFREQAEKIENATLTTRTGENEWEPIYRIEVPELRSAAFYKIVKLRGDLYRKYPDATISIEFRPMRELDEAENNPRLANL